MKNYLVELTFFLFGLYLLLQAQYITLLILLFLSLILVSKGIKYKASLLIPLVIILFITEYHKYFPYRQEIKNTTPNNNSNDSENDENIDNIDNEIIEIEGFKTNQEDIKIKKIKKEVRERAKSRKKIEKRLEKEIKKTNAGMPKRYINNQIKIKKKSNNLSEALDKWSLIKENLFIILNSE